MKTFSSAIRTIFYIAIILFLVKVYITGILFTIGEIEHPENYAHVLVTFRGR